MCDYCYVLVQTWIIKKNLLARQMGKSHRLCLSAEEMERADAFLKNLGVPNVTQMMKNILAGRLCVLWKGKIKK